jgi:hypothetical protein
VLCDEMHSGVQWMTPPKHQYVPADCNPSVAPDGDERARFTALVFGHGNGQPSCPGPQTLQDFLQHVLTDATPGGATPDAGFYNRGREQHLRRDMKSARQEAHGDDDQDVHDPLPSSC